MKARFLGTQFLCAAVFLVFTSVAAADEKRQFGWTTVVNNNDLMPPDEIRHFNSYNQPSINVNGLVVMRARSRGGPPTGPPTHGIYTRDMSNADSQIVRILDRVTPVPQPNNLGAVFVETPSFPRIDIDSDTIATRANHKPAYRFHLDDGTETRAGTTGIYANPFGELITGAAKLGDVSGFAHFRVPEFSGTRFEVFPGAPSITNGNTIVFKGNYTAGGMGRTGVYFRVLEPGEGGGTSPAILIANNTDTLIPGTRTTFGSTAPPNAAGSRVVFAGFDNEHAPTKGGIYMAALEFQPRIETLVSIGERVPRLSRKAAFTDLGEGVAFDGRFVGFWGAWGDETRTVRLYCKEEGNRERIDYCNQELVCEATGERMGDPNSICDDVTDPNHGQRCYTEKQVPVNQGFFVHDTRTHKTEMVARNTGTFDDFLYWNYSGKPPCSKHSHSDEEGGDDHESIRWRSAAFMAIANGPGATFRAVFKARSGKSIDGVYPDPVDGIYLRKGPGRSRIVTILDTTMEGQTVDPEAPAGSVISELGLEREGLRGDWLAITASMGVEGAEEEDDMAGIYITHAR